MTTIGRLCVAICLALTSAAGAWAQTAAPAPLPSFEEKLRQARYELRLEDGHFAGSAAPVLAEAITQSRYVLIGEDHITREVPQFTAAVCDLMGPQGLSTMVLEVSPEAAAFVSSTLRKPDRLARMAALVRRYPDSVAFLNLRQENDLAEHCAEAAPGLRLWGLDQPFIGSTGWLLDQMLAAHPGPQATAVLTRLKQVEQQGAARAQESGDPLQLFLVSVPEAELTRAAEILRRDGNPTANALLQRLIESHEIYLMNIQGHAGESNDQRARLLKRNLRAHLATTGPAGKMLVKFGDSHLYKGFNDLHQRDLGNYIAEFAEAQGATSLHICVLGAKGVHRLYGGYNRPGKLEPFVLGDKDFEPWLRPAVANRLPNAWTVYDLRKLRFQELGPMAPDLQRFLYGYDLLVIAPEITPADPVSP